MADALSRRSDGLRLKLLYETIDTSSEVRQLGRPPRRQAKGPEGAVFMGEPRSHLVRNGYSKDRNDIQTNSGSYELRIDCTSGGINFDRFIYWPSETYPDRIQDNRVERIHK